MILAWGRTIFSMRDKNLDLGEDKPSEVEAIGIGSSIIATA